jgi:hypothetical protein
LSTERVRARKLRTTYQRKLDTRGISGNIKNYVVRKFEEGSVSQPESLAEEEKVKIRETFEWSVAEVRRISAEDVKSFPSIPLFSAVKIFRIGFVNGSQCAFPRIPVL